MSMYAQFLSKALRDILKTPLLKPQLQRHKVRGETVKIIVLEQRRRILYRLYFTPPELLEKCVRIESRDFARVGVLGG